MSALAPDLFDRRYADLVRIGRAKLPGIAPEWTDYNAHDPGITLIELLAWSAEAQIYSLSRVRRDERAAYAALMGIGSHGTRPAQGLIWPDPSDPDGPSQTRKRGGVIEADAAIQMARSEGPTFHTGRRLLWIPARIELLQTRLPDGTSVDLTMANRRGGPAFQPFGYGDGRGAVLRMALVAPARTPLLEAGRPRNAMLAIGVRVDSSRTERATRPAIRPAPAPTLEVQLVTDDAIFALPIVEDSTRGLLQTGALLLDLAAVDAQPTTAILEFRMPNGTPRAPQLLRIEPNVLPVRQRAAIRECHDANGLPDQQFDLQVPGIAFEPGSAPVAIEVELLGTETAWIQCERLADHGPLDRVFAFDPVTARVAFGNGLNGSIPSAEATIITNYSTCDGAGGNLAANRKWKVDGFDGTFGVNPDPLVGGADRSEPIELRTSARAVLREEHALVSAADFELAALALTDLEVGRANLLLPNAGDVASGTLRLIVLRAGSRNGAMLRNPETRQWLAAIHTALAPQMLLGTRLSVAAPHYADFAITGEVEAEPGTDPAKLKSQVLNALERRLALVSDTPATSEWAFGHPVTLRDLGAWIQTLDNVRRVVALSIVPGQYSTTTAVTLGPTALPRLDQAASTIQIMRPDRGVAT